jgi:hypothetical protein
MVVTTRTYSMRRSIKRQLDDASVRLDLDVQPIALSNGVTRPGFTPGRAG